MDIPKLKNQKIERKKHENACATFDILELQIKNKQSIKEYAEKINSLWKGYFFAKGVDVSFGEKMKKDADERELLDIAITKSTLLYTLATDIKYEELTEVEEFEISKKVPFIKKLLDLKMRNFGSELVKEIFGDNVKLDLTEEGMVIVPETGENEIPN